MLEYYDPFQQFTTIAQYILYKNGTSTSDIVEYIENKFILIEDDNEWYTKFKTHIYKWEDMVNDDDSEDINDTSSKFILYCHGMDTEEYFSIVEYDSILPFESKTFKYTFQINEIYNCYPSLFAYCKSIQKVSLTFKGDISKLKSIIEQNKNIELDMDRISSTFQIRIS
eukprot:151082_1